MIYVHVAYTDGTDAKVPLDEVGDLQTDGVLLIVLLSDEINPQTGKTHGRVQQSSGWDHYALCRRRWDDADWTMLWGWDDDDHRWVRHTRPWEPCSKTPVSPPVGVMHLTFHGEAMSQEEYKPALRAADKKLR